MLALRLPGKDGPCAPTGVIAGTRGRITTPTICGELNLAPGFVGNPLHDRDLAVYHVQSLIGASVGTSYNRLGGCTSIFVDSVRFRFVSDLVCFDLIV